MTYKFIIGKDQIVWFVQNPVKYNLHFMDVLIYLDADEAIASEGLNHVFFVILQN